MHKGDTKKSLEPYLLLAVSLWTHVISGRCFSPSKKDDPKYICVCRLTPLGTLFVCPYPTGHLCVKLSHSLLCSHFILSHCVTRQRTVSGETSKSIKQNHLTHKVACLLSSEEVHGQWNLWCALGNPCRNMNHEPFLVQTCLLDFPPKYLPTLDMPVLCF